MNVRELRTEEVVFDARPREVIRPQPVQTRWADVEPPSLNPLDEVAVQIRTMTYGELMRMKDELDKICQPGEGLHFANLLHRWAMERATSQALDSPA
jgi:hypothetical protein